MLKHYWQFDTLGTCLQMISLSKQGVALTGLINRTGPPCSVGRPTAHPPTVHGSSGRPARTPTALQTTMTDARQQNNTGLLGGPVIIWMNQHYKKSSCFAMFYIYNNNFYTIHRSDNIHSSGDMLAFYVGNTAAYNYSKITGSGSRDGL